jgi:hypothetical protein
MFSTSSYSSCSEMAQVPDTLKDLIAKDKTIVTDYIHPHSLNSGIQIEEITPPKLGGEFPVDEAVLEGTSFPPLRGLPSY